MATKTPQIEEVAKLREAITATREELSGLDSRLLPKADALARLNAWIDDTAQTFESGMWFQVNALFAADARPSTSLGLAVVREHVEDGFEAADFSGLLCWLFGAELRARVTAAIQDLPLVDGDAVPAEDRHRVRMELERRLRDAELREERLIRGAEAQGIILERRGDADPSVVLATQV